MGFYCLLLRLYPTSFRNEYGSELMVTHEQLVRDRGRFMAALAALTDVVPNALLAHGRILRQDLRYAFRTIARAPGFAATVIIVTALGVGANTATFSVADFVLLRPLRYADPGRLVRLCEGPKEGGGWGCMNELSPANYRDVAGGTRTSFESWGAFTGTSVNLVGRGEPVRVGGTLVTPQVLPTLGVAPLLGRTFDSTGGRDANTAVLAYGFWQRHFGGDPGVLGSTIRLDGSPVVVIGVMPQGFEFPEPNAQMWLPLRLDETAFENRNNTYLHGIGRLKAGVTFEQGRADIDRVFSALSREYPASNAETGYSYFRLRDQVLPKFRVMLLALCGASLSLLLLTSANLANLLLARAAGREKELAVRTALGAGRERLVRQLLTESVLLAGLGGLAGVLVATVAMPLFSHLIPAGSLVSARPSLDVRVMVIAGALTALTGIAIGLLPAIRASRAGFGVLREGGRGGGRRQRLRSALVTGEVAISVALLISSGFLIRAIVRVQSVDPGFAAEDVLTLRTQLPSPRYDDSVRREQYYRGVLADVQALPGVSAAAFTSGLPMVLTGGITGVEVPGAEVKSSRTDGVSWRVITPQFFKVLGVEVRLGRQLEDGDAIGRPMVAIVSESFVQRYWPGRNPLGLTFTVRGAARTVVGVVRDIKVRGLERSMEPQIYLPAYQMLTGIPGLYQPKDLVIKAVAGEALLPSVRAVIRRADAEQPISDVRMMRAVVQRETEGRRAQVAILVALAVIALVLTAIGIQGLLAFLVTQRSQEIGVRLALGADPARVAGMIVAEAGRWTAIGGVLGVGIAYVAAKSMQALLFGLEPSDPLTFAAGLSVVVLVTLAGAVAPAWRAVRISPLVALRSD